MSTENTNNLFILATRKKYRFDSTKGGLLLEDLFDLKLDDLDKIAVSLDEKLQKAGKKSFIGKRNESSTDESNKLEIVKFVIETKQSEDEEKKIRVEKAGQKAFLKGLLEKKQMEQLEGLSLEEIQKQIDQLG